MNSVDRKAKILFSNDSLAELKLQNLDHRRKGAGWSVFHINTFRRASGGSFQLSSSFTVRSTSNIKSRTLHPYLIDIPSIHPKRFGFSFLLRTANEYNTLSTVFQENFSLGLLNSGVNHHHPASIHPIATGLLSQWTQVPMQAQLADLLTTMADMLHSYSGLGTSHTLNCLAEMFKFRHDASWRNLYICDVFIHRKIVARRVIILFTRLDCKRTTSKTANYKISIHFNPAISYCYFRCVTLITFNLDSLTPTET